MNLDDTNNLPYYKNQGWMSPEELILSAINARNVDTGVFMLLFALATIRAMNSPELELRFSDFIQEFLKANVDGYDDMIKRGKAGLN